jgi:hypothetical protein
MTPVRWRWRAATRRAGSRCDDCRRGLRVGALVEADERSLEFRRRKGNRDTLMTGEGAPMPAGEAALGAYLGGADRRFFTRMFCLDHARLRQGGREILEAQDDVGQILYSAAAGVVGLREQIGKMNDEANAFWARRASQRKYNLADERLKAAEYAVREHTVTASRWHDLRNTLDAASAAYGGIDTDIQTKSAEARKLTRIRRVCRHVRARAELNAAIEALGEVIALPENASQFLESALNDDNQAAARLATVVEQIDSLTGERSALAYDEALIARADDINRLHERRIQVQAGTADLPKRRAELTAAESHLKRLAAELEWATDNSDKIIASVPARAKLAHARALSNRRGELLTAANNARAALDEAEERAQMLRREIEEAGSLTDVSALAATISAVREAGDLTAHAATLEGEVRRSQRSIEELLSTMHPRVSDAAALASMAVPPKATLEAHRDAVRALEQNVQSCRNRTQNAERDLLRQTRAYERIAREERAVPLQELQRLREHRDSGWSIIRRKYVDGSSVPDEEIHAFGSDQTLIDAYQAAVVSADVAADRRFEKAEIVAQLAVSARQIDETRELLDTLRQEERALAEQVQALDTAWQRLWNGSVLNPPGADAMLEWIELRSQILEIAFRRAATERDAATVRQEEARACDALVRELKSLGVDTIPIAARPLRVIVEMALEIQRRHENSASARKGLEAGFKKATTETGRKRKALEVADAELKAWQDQWTAAIQSLRLNAAATSEVLDGRSCRCWRRR